MKLKSISIMLLALAIISSPAFATIKLTEVDLDNGIVELTNISGSVSSGVILEWCVPFQYGVLETAGYSFEPGETRTYSLSTTLTSADDLWIYKDRMGGFGGTDQVISGVVWGADQSGQGRVNSVVTNTGGAAWASNTDFVSTAGILAGQSIQVEAPALNANSSSGWTITDETLGSFGATTDVDGDGAVTCDDITFVMQTIFDSSHNALADLTGDGVVNIGDRDAWLREAGNFLPGDANLDGTVDGQDFLVWNMNKFQAVSGYCSGDFNGDQNVDGSDFLIWNQFKFQTGDTNAVPEPRALLFVYLFAMSMFALYRRQRVTN